MARLALLRMGMGAAATERAVAMFRSHDEEQLDAQYAVQNDEAQLIQTAQQAAEQLRELFETDVAGPEARLGAKADESGKGRSAG
jgi:hypothetical protein